MSDGSGSSSFDWVPTHEEARRGRAAIKAHENRPNSVTVHAREVRVKIDLAAEGRSKRLARMSKTQLLEEIERLEEAYRVADEGRWLLLQRIGNAVAAYNQAERHRAEAACRELGLTRRKRGGRRIDALTEAYVSELTLCNGDAHKAIGATARALKMEPQALARALLRERKQLEQIGGVDAYGYFPIPQFR